MGFLEWLGKRWAKGLDFTAVDSVLKAEALAAEGVHWIDWNCLTGDAEPKNRQPKDVAGMVKMATSAISEGLKVSVMLAHDAEGKDMTVKAMPQIISAYKEAGYKFGVIA